VNDNSRSTGGSWADYDHDGYLDLFVSNGNQNVQNNLLYLNDQTGSLIKIDTGAIVSDGGSSVGSTWGDPDNDGDPDLFVANREGADNFLYQNNANGSFTRIDTGDIVNDGGNSNISHWVDIDQDNDLDLFVINFLDTNFLYFNNGDGSFTKVDTGLIVTDPAGFSISGNWGNYDNDGDLDLFVCNGGSQNNLLYQNNGNSIFTKITTGDIVNDFLNLPNFTSIDGRFEFDSCSNGGSIGRYTDTVDVHPVVSVPIIGVKKVVFIISVGCKNIEITIFIIIA